MKHSEYLTQLHESDVSITTHGSKGNSRPISSIRFGDIIIMADNNEAQIQKALSTDDEGRLDVQAASKVLRYGIVAEDGTYPAYEDMQSVKCIAMLSTYEDVVQAVLSIGEMMSTLHHFAVSHVYTDLEDTPDSSFMDKDLTKGMLSLLRKIMRNGE